MTKKLQVLLFILGIGALSLLARLPILFPGVIAQRQVNLLEPGTPNATRLLGAEYFNIALSLHHDGTYSNPFGVPTGPTAWMPPLYTFILAGLITLFKSGAGIECSIMAIDFCLLVAIACSIASLNERRYGPKWFAISLVLFFAFYFYFFFWFFLSVHDHFLIAALVALMVLELDRLTAKPNVHNGLRWGLLGGLAALSSPCLLFAWGVVTLYLGGFRHRIRWLGQSLAVVIVCALPWVIRNVISFGKFIPVKSNLMFDLAFANVHAVDGVYHARDFHKHPFVLGFTSPQVFEQRGWTDEARIIDEASNEFRSLLTNNPMTYVWKVAKRLVCVTLYYKPHYADSGQRLLLLRRLLYPLPFLSIIIIFLSWRSASDFYKGLGLLYVAYFAPFVMVAFYHRYFVSLVPLFVATLPVLAQVLALSQRLPIQKRQPLIQLRQ